VNDKTDYRAKPIPLRQFDWSAIDDDTYDGQKIRIARLVYGATEQEPSPIFMLRSMKRKAASRHRQDRCATRRGNARETCYFAEAHDRTIRDEARYLIKKRLDYFQK